MRRLVQMAALAATVGLAAGPARAGAALLSAEQANQVARAYAEQVKGCYFRHALAEPAATGRVRVDLHVRSDGGVARARVEAPGLVRRGFERCVVARALTWRFPSSAAWTEVRMPFRFHLPVRFRSRARG